MKKHGWWMAVMCAAVVVMSVVTFVIANGYSKALEDLKLLQADYDVLQTANKEYLYEWGKERRLRDQYKADLDATPVCIGAVTRIEYLEGQLDSCTRAYAEERHDRKFYQNALEDVPAYCSLGLNQFVIDGLREELSTCRREKVGAPCHSHYEGLHCTWEPCTMLYECAFGELGWIGPDRVMCDNFGNTSYNEARTACFSDRNCSSCIEMTGGNLGHCWAFAYYP